MGVFSEVLQDIQKRRETMLQDIENTVPYIQSLINRMALECPECGSSDVLKQVYEDYAGVEFTDHDCMSCEHNWKVSN